MAARACRRYLTGGSGSAAATRKAHERRAAGDFRGAALACALHAVAMISYLRAGGETPWEVTQRLASVALGVSSWALPLLLVRAVGLLLLVCVLLGRYALP